MSEASETQNTHKNNEAAEQSLEKAPAIHNKEAYIVTRDKLPEIIEAPCLPACIDLYDKNIRTVASNGNIQYATSPPHPDRDLFVHMDYDSLDDNNKQIAYGLRLQGLVDIDSSDRFGGIDKKVIIRQNQL